MSSRNKIDLPPGSEALQREYRFLRELGRGGSAVVYLAEDRELRRKVAVKLIRAPLAADEEALLRFTREARTAALLHHSNIVAVHAVKRLRGDMLAMVMQYVAGGTLKDLIRREAPLPFATVEQVLRDVATALELAHSRGIVHRDVKPENIFLDKQSGAALLADFGIAHNLDGAPGPTLNGVVLGTPAYMAPEQIDDRELDGRADLYSLGAVGWEMLTGEAPWEGETLFSILYNQKHRALPPVRKNRPDAPFHLWHTIETALQKEPERRYPNARAFLEALDQARLAPPWSRWAASWRLRRGVEPADAPPPPVVIVSPVEASLSPLDEEGATLRWRPALPPAAGTAAHAAADGETGSREPQPIAAGAGGAVADAEEGAHSGAVVRRSWPRSLAPVLRMGSLRIVPAVGGLLLLPALGLALFGLGQDPVPASPDRPAAAGMALHAANRLDLATPPPAAVPVVADSVATEMEASEVEGAAVADEPPVPGTDAAPHSDAAAPAAAAASPEPAGDPAAPANAPTSAPTNAAVNAPAPVEVRAAERAAPVALSAGGMHTCSLLRSGEVLCWGGNSAGQLGSGRQGRSPAPTRVEGARFQEIATGMAHSCGLTPAGEALCWGSNQNGQLGNETRGSRAVPILVAGGWRFSRIQAGGAHTCALTRQGEVFCWGDNRHGQLGDGTGTARSTPVRAGSGSFSSLAVGWNHSCGLDRFGQPFCWGANADGQLGTEGRVDEAAPVPIASRLRFSQIVTGGAHTCGLAEGGTAYCWGRNGNGQLGDGTTVNQPRPVAVAGDLLFAALTAGSLHTCGLTRAGEAYCWGRNAHGQLGNGTTADRPAPVRVEGGPRFTSLHSSGAHTCGIARSGEQYCWGHNVEGQLGDGTRSHRTRPVRVELPDT